MNSHLDKTKNPYIKAQILLLKDEKKDFNKTEIPLE